MIKTINDLVFFIEFQEERAVVSTDLMTLIPDNTSNITSTAE